MPKQYKIDAVAEIESKLESNAGVFVVSYNGLTVLQAQELRKQLRECGAQMKVYKNNLVRIALENKEQPGVFVVSYNGLTVLQAQELRKQLRECGAQMKVYKNNLVRIALENKEQPNLDEILAGPLAYVFFEEEPVSAAKVLKEFAKKSKGVLEVKGGISDGQAVTAAEVDAIAELPSKDQLNGLTVLQAQELRKQLRECGEQMKVYKNNHVRIALENKELPNHDEILAGPLAYVFFEEEPVSAAKVLKEFAKKSTGVHEVKGGISDGQAVTAAEVDAIAELPSKDQLMGQIAGLISGFARDIALRVNGFSSGLAGTVQQISEQKAA